MPPVDGADASSTPTMDSKEPPVPEKATDVSIARSQPPPETKESLRLRRYVILSFWAVAILLGLPIWWKTTAIYRAELPLQTMTDWADGKICKLVFPLRIALEAPVLPAPDAQHLIRTTQHSLDDLNEFPAHHLRLMLANSPLTPNVSQQVVTDDGPGGEMDDRDIALTVRLIPVETGITPRSLLQPYAPTLDVYYSANQIPPASATGSPLATFIAHELHKIFEEEQALLTYLLTTTSGAHAANVKALSPETWSELARQSTRALKYAPTYHLTFSLFSPTSLPSSWEIEAALQQYITPLLATFSTISNFTVDTQVQLYATFSPSVRQPEYDEALKAWTLRREVLSGFINAAEWPLSPSIGTGPTVNFILYVPEQSQSPLVVKENGGNSWLIPQWGGVLILNPSNDVMKTNTPTALTKEALAPAMHAFSDQLLSLLGLPQTPASLPLRLSTLARVRTASLVFSASSTLGALARLTRQLKAIPIPDTVAKSVDLTLAHLQQACDSLREGKFQGALEHARIAETEAEKAFFERSMVGQVYFPDEHKVAVYLPLLGPVAVPLLMAGIKELKESLSAVGLGHPRRTTPACPKGTFSRARGQPTQADRHYGDLMETSGCLVAVALTQPRSVFSRGACAEAPRSGVVLEGLIEVPESHFRSQGVDQIKQILNGATSEGDKGLSGLVFVAIDKSGKTLVEHASGTRGVQQKEPMDMDTIFWIASMTKIVATIAVLQLVEQGKVSLDDPETVKKYAPEIGRKKVYADGVTPQEQQGAVTLRMLLAHTAGFAYAFWDPRVNINTSPVGTEEFSGDESDITNSPMVNQPGSMWEYGVNIDWAGIILERVTGLKLNDYMQKYIFEPLGIKDVTMFPSKELQKNLAVLHQRAPDGALSERPHLFRRALTAETPEQQAAIFNAGGHGLFAKPKEYVKVMGALLNDGTSPITGKKILEKATVELMWENQIPDQPNFARGGPAPCNPLLANHSPEMYPQSNNPPQGWGLSMFLTIAPGDSGRGANTGWWAGLANSFFWVDREKGVAGVIAGQVVPFGDGKVIPAWFGVEKAIYDNLEN
ncbi:phosphatidylinositol-glycan biosynthesis class S protein-domain-containing protein [Lophiotrema nucula]|uniref:Phosphatidylinositol-glycan biosynthesis class S protein-domain-containing protein n=1 Tax=Lophiotrema nucula TaxID=690887 RepID=A0A6A5YT94_9PLEO|nr:phosphatidylinositol-glycan biosynthesis class S protein-domain-containing protein [Lophiotrema nucula]